MSTLIEINRGANGEPGDLVNAHTYIHQLQARLEQANEQAAALQDILTAARQVVRFIADGADCSDAMTNPTAPESLNGSERIQRFVDAVRAYDRRPQQ